MLQSYSGKQDCGVMKWDGVANLLELINLGVLPCQLFKILRLYIYTLQFNNPNEYTFSNQVFSYILLFCMNSVTVYIRVDKRIYCNIVWSYLNILLLWKRHCCCLANYQKGTKDLIHVGLREQKFSRTSSDGK